MTSQYVIQVRGVAANLRSEGWDLRANQLEGAANRMERMEDLLLSLKDQIQGIDHTGTPPTAKTKRSTPTRRIE